MPMSLFILGSAVCAYFALHSILASQMVKDFLMARFLPRRIYRLVFNGLSLLLLIPLTWFFFSLEKTVVCTPFLKVPFAGWVFMAIGLYYIFAAFRRYDLAEFSGLLQMKSGGGPMREKLQTHGVNRQVRHPLYLGTLLAVWGWFVISPTDAVLLLAFLTTLYRQLGEKPKGRQLVRKFGEAYRQ